MVDLTLQRLISTLVLLTTTFSIIAVEAFFSSAINGIRLNPSVTHRALPILHIFGERKNGKKKKNYYLIDDDRVAGDRDQRIAQGSIMKKKIKKLKMRKPSKKHGTSDIVLRWRRFRQQFRYLIFRNTVYVLQCENEKYYIGSTRNRKKRYRQHFENPRGGSKWTRKHKPIKVIAEYKRIPKRYLMGMESQKTAEYMMKFGVNNVRGASYCILRDYTTDDAADLTGFLGHHNQLDYQDLYQELKKTLPRADLPSSSVIPSAMLSTKKDFRDRIKGDEDDENRNSNSDHFTDIKVATKSVRRRSSRSKRRNRRRKRAKRFKQSESNRWISDSSKDGDTTFENRIEIPPRPPRATKRTGTPIVEKPNLEKGRSTRTNGGKVMKITFEEEGF